MATRRVCAAMDATGTTFDGALAVHSEAYFVGSFAVSCTTPEGANLALVVHPAFRVVDVKYLVAKLSGLRMDQQRVRCDSKGQLEDHHTLAHYRIAEGARLHAERPRARRHSGAARAEA